jgi:hypothetical protein
MATHKTKEIFIRRKTIDGKPFGPIMLLKSKRPPVAYSIIFGMEVLLHPSTRFATIAERYYILKGISLLVSYSCMERLISGTQTKVLHKITANCDITIAVNVPDYIKLYDPDGNSRFYKIDNVHPSVNLRDKCISIELGEMFYEKRS